MDFTHTVYAAYLIPIIKSYPSFRINLAPHKLGSPYNYSFNFNIFFLILYFAFIDRWTAGQRQIRETRKESQKGHAENWNEKYNQRA